MAGFFTQWAANAAEYKRLQQELTEIFAKSGVNFMHIHPEITRFLVGVAKEQGAFGAITRLNETTEMLAETYPGLTQEQAQQQLIRTCKTINKIAGQFGRKEAN